MIEIIVNGETRTFDTERTVAQLCREIGAPATGVAIALNYELVPRSQYEKVILRKNDKIEIITATAGG